MNKKLIGHKIVEENLNDVAHLTLCLLTLTS